MIIQEQALERLMQCPMMTPTSPSPAETCAYALASWVLRQSFEGKFVGKPEEQLHKIRGKVIELWKGDKAEVGVVSRTAAYRLLNLIFDYEVMHLEQPYNLTLGGYTIQGKYALLRKRKGECLPNVLVLHTNEPDLKHDQALPPDVATLARYVHMVTNTGHNETQVLHYPVFRGKLWVNKTVNVPLAKRYLEGMLKVAALRPLFPIMGGHCAVCATKPCLEVFNG